MQNIPHDLFTLGFDRCFADQAVLDSSEIPDWIRAHWYALFDDSPEIWLHMNNVLTMELMSARTDAHPEWNKLAEFIFEKAENYLADQEEAEEDEHTDWCILTDQPE